jgi:hypothetical protein
MSRICSVYMVVMQIYAVDSTLSALIQWSVVSSARLVYG